MTKANAMRKPALYIKAMAALADEVGLVNAAVTAFDEDDSLLGTWAPTLRVPETAALQLLDNFDSLKGPQGV
jgi:hypothetical protein